MIVVKLGDPVRAKIPHVTWWGGATDLIQGGDNNAPIYAFYLTPSS